MPLELLCIVIPCVIVIGLIIVVGLVVLLFRHLQSDGSSNNTAASGSTDPSHSSFSWFGGDSDSNSGDSDGGSSGDSGGDSGGSGE